MKLQISSRLAIFALLELAAHPERQLSVAEIGKIYGASSHHLAKVMHVLGRAGLVHSMRGAGGGYQFGGNSRRITLLDIIRLFEDLGSKGVSRLPEDRADAGRALREILEEVDATVQATLGSITIATALKLMNRRQSQASRHTRRRAPRSDMDRRKGRVTASPG